MALLSFITFPVYSLNFFQSNLGWTDLKTRRNNSRLLCMFKILNELVKILINDCLIPADRRTRGGHNSGL